MVLLERDPALVAQPGGDASARLSAEAVRIERGDALQWMARGGAGRASSWCCSIRRSMRRSPLPALAAAARIVAPGGFVYVEAPEAIEPRAGGGGGPRALAARRAPAMSTSTCFAGRGRLSGAATLRRESAAQGGEP